MIDHSDRPLTQS